MRDKVCRLVWDYPLGGQATYGLQPVFVNLSEQQARQGYEVHVVTTLSSAQPANEVVNGVTVHRVPAPFNLNALRMVRKLTHHDDSWVVHTHATCGFALFATKNLRRFPMVSHVHGTSRSHHIPLKVREGKVVVDYSSIPVNYHMFRERLLWSSADRILTVSQASADDVTETYGIKPRVTRVVYNGVDPNVFKPEPDGLLPSQLAPFEGKRIILYVGHFGVRKGLSYLIRAMKTISKEVPDVHLVCVGGVPKWLGGIDFAALLRQEAEVNGVADHVTLMGAVKHNELARFYNASELFVLPSYYETFSKVCVEAMACGRPVVATRSGGIPEVVEDGKTGSLTTYGSVPDLTSKILELLTDGAKSKQMGKTARERVLKYFTWEEVADRVSSVYKELD